MFNFLFINHFAKKDNWHETDLSTGNLGYGWMHYAFIRNLKPQRVLSIGSRYGYIPAICALACRDNKQGLVDFVDAGFNQDNPLDKKSGRHWGGVGFWKTKQGKKQFHKFGLKKYIQQHIMLTKDFFAKHPHQKWQYIHIDGDHSYQGVRFDFNKSWSRLSKGGFIVIHDIHTPDADGNKYGTRKFWQELKQNNRYNAFELPGLCGVGFIQK